MTSVQDAARQAQATQNPLLDPQFLIPFDRIAAEHVGAAIPLLIRETRAGLETLKGSGAAEPSFLSDFDRLTERLDTAWKIVIHLDSVVSSPEWREAKQAMMPLVSAFYTDLGMDTGLYAALKAYASTDGAGALDPVRARFLKLSLDGFRRSGAELAEAERERLKALNIELDEVTSRYGSNVMDGISAFELYVPTERLTGVPERVRTGTLQQSGEHVGLHRLTLHAPTYLPIMTYAEDRSLREELYRAFNEVGIGEGRDNRELLPRILALRQEKAELLGYRNYADFLLEQRMAGSGQRALDFEEDLTARTRPAFERENGELEGFYRQHAGPDAGPLSPWDITYWAEKQRAARYDLDDEELRPYFPIEHVLSGLYEIAHRLFGITVREAQAPVWHPEVRFYEMHDEAGVHVASFYTDWFPRDSKRGGAWMNSLRTGGPAMSNPAGQGFVPHLGLMCGNMTPPEAGAPALLSHDEVETVFHEFGHLLHSSLSRVEVRDLAGTHVAWDFVELPSHLMENWTWNREALDLFAQHHQTGERLPDELYDRMVRARNFRAGNAAMRQYSFGMQDLSLHVRYTPADGDVMSHASAIAAGYQPTEPLPNDARIANFGHLFSSAVGYAAGYYSYKWAEVLEADAFTRFEREGVLNRQTGQALVDSVLSRGNGTAPEELFREFMGRDPDPSALLRRSGLDGETGV